MTVVIKPHLMFKKKKILWLPQIKKISFRIAWFKIWPAEWIINCIYAFGTWLSLAGKQEDPASFANNSL